MANNSGGGNNKKGGGTPNNDSRGEILVAGLMGQFAQAIGMQVDITGLPGYAQIMKLAKGNPQLAFSSAATFFATLLRLDDVQREMVEGVFRALGAKAAATAGASESEQVTAVNEEFNALGGVKNLKALREAGMLGKVEAVPYMEAITHLDPRQRRAVAGVVSKIKGFDPTKVILTPRAARGVALTVLDRNPQTPGELEELAKELSPLFVPKGKIENEVGDFMKAINSIKKSLAKAAETPGADGHSFIDQVGGNSEGRRAGTAVARDAMAQLLRSKGLKP